MGALSGFVAKFLSKPAPVATRAELADFMDSRAAFLAQKCIVEFCRVRSGVYWQKLFAEEEFQRELDKSRWRSFPATLAMVAEMVEGSLREAAGLDQRKLPAALEGVAAEICARYPVPEGEGETFWADARAMVHDRLAATQSGPPRPVRDMPAPMARKVFDALPLHKDIVTNDYDYIFNNLRMNLLRAHEDFLGAADLTALARDLVGRNP